MEVMDMRGAWVSLQCRSPWALRNWQLRGMGRQRSCEEVLMQKGLRVANKRQQKKSSHYLSPRIIHLGQQILPLCLSGALSQQLGTWQ